MVLLVALFLLASSQNRFELSLNGVVATTALSFKDASYEMMVVKIGILMILLHAGSMLISERKSFLLPVDG